MKLVGSKQQLCTAGWIMAGLVLVTINGFGFLGLESEPLRGSTPAISSLRQKDWPDWRAGWPRILKMRSGSMVF